MAVAVHGTTTANVVTTVTIDVGGFGGFVVVNRDQTGEIWVRYDGVNPVALADDSFVVLGARQFDVRRKGNIQVRLLSTVARAYSVEAS